MDLFPFSEETLQTMSREQLVAVVLASQKLHPPRLPTIPIGYASRRRIPKRGGQAVLYASTMKDAICSSCGSAHPPYTSFNCNKCGECFCNNCENEPIDNQTVYRICKACRSETIENKPKLVRREVCTECNTTCEDFYISANRCVTCRKCLNTLAKPLVECTYCGNISTFICRICKKTLCGACEDGAVTTWGLKPISCEDRTCWTCDQEQLKQTQPALKPLKACSVCKKIPLDAYICYKCGILVCHECQDTLESEPTHRHFCRECCGIIKRGAVGAA